MQKFLVISPHPDDADFGAAGTVAKLVREGSRVEYLVVSDGSKGSHKVGFDGKKLAKTREREQKEAARILGVEKVTFLRQVDGTLENTINLRKKLVGEIRRARPDIVLSFDPSSLQFESVYRSHHDHRMAAEAVFDAVYPAVGNSSFFPELLEKGLKPHHMQEVWFFATPRPNKWVDITKYIEQKLAALLAHESQHADTRVLREHIEQQAKQDGEKENMRYAECFRVIDFSYA